MKIALDLMGSQTSLKSFKAALIHQRKEHFILVGTKQVLKSFPNFEHVVVDHFVKMDDLPKQVLRQKELTSMKAAIDLVATKQCSGMISCGNTGALVALSHFHLKKDQPFSRIGLIAHVPTKKRPLAICDVGANLFYDANTLVEYGQMAVAMQKKLFGLKKPKVGLLNIGHEATKGKKHHKKAYLLFQRPTRQFEFVGNIEPKNIFSGEIDVLVTDGFSGNIFLKTAEGVAGFLQHQYQFDLPKLSFGAVVSGIKGLVIKCHGKSQTQDLEGAIEKALLLSD